MVVRMCLECVLTMNRLHEAGPMSEIQYPHRLTKIDLNSWWISRQFQRNMLRVFPWSSCVRVELKPERERDNRILRALHSEGIFYEELS